MNSKEYLEKALITESLEAFNTDGYERLLHAGVGLATETGEFLDTIKKSVFYGRDLDVVNLKEELGDVLWYVAVAMDVLGTDFETEMSRNIKKLQLRYGDKFTQAQEKYRDLNSERKILEK